MLLFLFLFIFGKLLKTTTNKASKPNIIIGDINVCLINKERRRPRSIADPNVAPSNPGVVGKDPWVL